MLSPPMIIRGLVDVPQAALGDPPRSRGYDKIGRVNKFFLQLLPQTDAFKAMPKFKTCAVVSEAFLSMLPSSCRHPARDGCLRSRAEVL